MRRSFSDPTAKFVHAVGCDHNRVSYLRNNQGRPHVTFYKQLISKPLPWQATRCICRTAQKCGNMGLRAALHLEAGSIRCIRGLKSSLVIGQNAQISPNPFTTRGWADLLVWFFLLKNVCYDTAWVRWIGCTQNGGPILGLEANVIFH
jgi:hypothetical protein